MLEPPVAKRQVVEVNSDIDCLPVKSNNQSVATPSSSLSFQVARGNFSVSPLTHHALVISQGWPSWTFGLEGLGFRTLSTSASFSSLSSREEFKATNMASTLIEREAVSKWATSHAFDGAVFVQGDQQFLDMAHQKLKGFQDLICVFGCSDTTFSTSDSWKESHSNAGGVTDGEWAFYSPNIELPSEKSFGIHRVLKHVLRTTEGASSVRQLPDAISNVLSPNSRAIWKDKTPVVSTFSVFDKTGPVTRVVSEEELMDIYDVELNTQQSLLKYWRHSKSKSSRSYSQQIPTKVLREVSLRLVKVLTQIDRHVKERSGEPMKTKAPLEASKLSAENDAKPTLVTNAVVGVEDTREKAESRERAACNDDAEAVPEDWDIWLVNNFDHESVIPKICNGKYDDETHRPFFTSLRDLMMRRYKKNVLRSLLNYLKLEHCKGRKFQDKKVIITKAGRKLTIDLPEWIKHRKKQEGNKHSKYTELWKDLEIGRDAVGRAANSTWWNWDAGSTLFFWRWPTWTKKSVRDGVELFVDWANLPNYWKRQQWPDEENSIKKLRSKISNVRMKKYIQPGFVKSLTSYFAVPKAETDVRIVYDGTACGLNDSLWAPNFMLPTVDSILRNASASTWFGDIDLGEMFLNYPLDERIRPYAGVDVTYVDHDLSNSKARRVLERWTRCLMGFKPSPYVTTQTFAWSEEIIMGDHLDENNPFFWDTVKHNYPGTEDYDPAMPWIYKWNGVTHEMAAFFGTYIDDIRAGGSTELSCKRALHRIASVINYLGQQDASRKRGQPTQTPRAWAGAKCASVEGKGLYVLCMESKWNKAKKIINDLYDHVVVKKEDLVKFKELQSEVGFLCHVSRTYPIIFPYLKGFYNTLNNWRWDRDSDGWKLNKSLWMELISGDVSFDGIRNKNLSIEDRARNFKKRQSSDAPSSLVPVPRLAYDLKALKELFSSSLPTLRLIRGALIKFALFSFGDASGGGFGSSWEIDDSIEFRFGTWDENTSNESSNYRELRNLVDTLEEINLHTGLSGSEIFLFTDNSTSEAAFYNGSSKSEKLFDLVLRVKKLEMHNQAKVHIIHVSGERMKVQGSDGLSRGNLNIGVMAGKKMLDFVPIHLTALERTPLLKPWLQSFMDTNVEWLTTKDWFTRGHDIIEGKFEMNTDGFALPCTKSGTFVWTPAPCAAEAAVEELRKARHKRQKSKHVFIVPRLMQPLWRKHLFKAADIVLTLKPGHPAWPIDMYEPLTIAFVFPFISFKPWQLRGSPQLMALGKQLCEVWVEDTRREGPLLRKLWKYQEQLEGMPTKLARKLLCNEQISQSTHLKTGKRRRSEMEEEKRGAKICMRKKG